MTKRDDPQPPPSPAEPRGDARPRAGRGAPGPREIGGAEGPEPTRYGDWEHKGRCTDF